MMNHKIVTEVKCMIFESITDNVVLVELSATEMKKYNITYETLNDDEDTNMAIKNILSLTDSAKKLEKGNVTVEAMPIQDGGCFFIFTFSDKKIRYRVKKNDCSTIFETNKINDLLDFVSFLKSHPESPKKCDAFKLKNNYYLHFGCLSPLICTFVEEFGKQSQISYEKLNEYGENLGSIYLQ